MKDLNWFVQSIGSQVMRNGVWVNVPDYKTAQYFHSLQPHFSFTKTEPIIHLSDSTCTACEG